MAARKRNKVAKVKLLLVLLLLLGSALNGLAFNAAVSGTEITVRYEEPAANEDGSPLKDFSHTTIYYTKGGQGAVKAATVAASSPAGGATVTQTFIVPVERGQEVEVDIWATASDKNQNESAESNHVKVQIDRLAPGAPK